ncbi:MAG: type II toxin-antitoxin system PemK/MazF family toxin [Treponema sp.]|nr:type II toxin-antitoxin system PemK/MazF family toxin [Treponema sp.]
MTRLYPGEAVVNLNNQKNKAMSDQIMSADKSRFKNKMGDLTDTDMLLIETAMKNFFDLS